MTELIYNGKTYSSAGQSLLKGSIFIADSLPAVSLGVDSLTAVVIDTDLQTFLLAADGLPAVTSDAAFEVFYPDPAVRVFTADRPSPTLRIFSGADKPFAADGLIAAGDWDGAREMPLAANDRLAAGLSGLLLSRMEGLFSAGIREYYPIDKLAKYGDVVRHYRSGKQFGKFFIETVKRIGKYRYELSCVSAIGLLLTSEHYGGIYSGERAAEVLRDIVGGVISYTLDASLADVPIYGLLPKASRRDNLRDFLFAVGGQVRKDSLGELNIIPMTAGSPYEISADEFYMGGSVTGGNHATGINLTEHSYMRLPGDEVILESIKK